MSKCRYEAMGMGHCDSTPEQIPCFPCRERHGGVPRNTYRSPVSHWLEGLQAKMVAAAGLPKYVLTGTPNGSSGPFFVNGSPTPDWRREYMGEWTAPGTAMEVEEQLQRRNDHVDALQHALNGVAASRAAEDRVLRVCGERRADDGAFCAGQVGHDGPHEWAREVRYTMGWQRVLTGHRDERVYDFPCICGTTIRGTDRDRGKRCEHEVACPGCGTPVAFTANDCLSHHHNGSAACPWSGHQRAAVERAIAVRAAETKAYQDAGVPINDYCACGRTMPTTAKHCKKCEPKPPTLREWLGDRVSELGPWAEVLREQPVPAGQIVGWEWYQTEIMPRLWMLRAKERAGAQVFGPSDTIDFLTRWEDFDGDCLRESLQMALFARHPSVKPEPRLTIGCEDQYEVMP